ncbi:MAG TPA: peptidase MA family metallohydrolase [Gemmatimonadota bacterium]|nr:peptidase MA family metallohydrolase [Gemmatimonadota bacterium]
MKRGVILAWLAALALASGAGVEVARGQDGPAGTAIRRLVVEGPGGRPLVFHHAPADSAIVERLAEASRGFIPAPVAALELPPDTFDVVVASSEAAFREMTGGRAPDWGLAVAFPGLRRIVIRSPRITGRVEVDPAVVLRHELAHVYLGAALDDGGERLPRWFNEGFAALSAEEWRWVDPYRLAWARLTGTLTPLAGLHDTFPEMVDPSVAYTQSMAAVRGLHRRGGDEGLGYLLARMRAGATFDESLRATYGLTLAQFYEEWESELGQEYGWAVALTGQEGLWVVLAIVVLALYAIRRRSLRREIERRKRREDRALGEPGDHALGAEEWERYWEWDDDEWKGEG